MSTSWHHSSRQRRRERYGLAAVARAHIQGRVEAVAARLHNCLRPSILHLKQRLLPAGQRQTPPGGRPSVSVSARGAPMSEAVARFARRGTPRRRRSRRRRGRVTSRARGSSTRTRRLSLHLRGRAASARRARAARRSRRSVVRSGPRATRSWSGPRPSLGAARCPATSSALPQTSRQSHS